MHKVLLSHILRIEYIYLKLISKRRTNFENIDYFLKKISIFIHAYNRVFKLENSVNVMTGFYKCYKIIKWL